MNSKQRILNVLDRKAVDRIPVDIWHTSEVEKSLIEHTGAADDFDMWKKLGLDKIVWVFMDYKTETGGSAGSQVGARAAGERTMWGVPLKDISSGEAHYQEFGASPMKGYDSPGDVDRYPYWPDPDHFDYEGAVSLARRASQDFAVIGPWVSFFEIYCQLRGIEQALMDVLMYPDLVQATLDRVEDIQTQMMKRYLDQAAQYIDLVFVSDDIGGQSNLLIAPESWELFLRPRMERWCDLIHSYGLKVFYHTDGAAEALIGPLIDCGIDVLNPIQHACPGMETDKLKRKYGDRIIFHGGIDNQRVLPFGTPDDVRKETLHCLETMGAGREGYICSSCHNVQAGTPVANILAMIETVHGW
jgi:uroporphyrinogen decarboxylase